MERETERESCHSINFQKLLWRKCKDGALVLDYLLNGMLHCLAEISELLPEKEKKCHMSSQNNLSGCINRICFLTMIFTRFWISKLYI